MPSCHPLVSGKLDDAYQKLKTLVLTNQLRPDEHLQIGPLAERLRVGLTPMREALIRLAAEDLISMHPKRGFFAKVLTVSDLHELHRFAYSLLRSSLEWGTERFEAKDVKAEIVRKLSHLNDGQHILAAAQAIEHLYEEVACLGKNAEMRKILRKYNDRTRVTRLIYIEQVEQLQGTIDFVFAVMDDLKDDDRGSALAKLQTRFETKMTHLPLLVKEATFNVFAEQ
jgi:DNA-binding GntR family transcriptional regulator